MPEFPEFPLKAGPIGLVTAEVPWGLVVVQDKLTLQLLAPETILQEGEAGVRVPDMTARLKFV